MNRTRVYLDPEGLTEGELRAADGDVMTEQCEGCGENILKSGTVKGSATVRRGDLPAPSVWQDLRGKGCDREVKNGI